MQESVQDKAPERPAQAGQLKVSTGGAAAPFVDNRPSSAAQLKLAQMAHTAPKVVAQRRQMNVIHGGTAQLEEDDEPLQGKMEPAQLAEQDSKVQAETAAPVQSKADPTQLAAKDGVGAPAEPAQLEAQDSSGADADTAQLEASGVRQLAIIRDWDENLPAAEPTRAPQAPPQAMYGGYQPQMPVPPQFGYPQQMGQQPAAAQAPPKEKLGFFGRIKRGVKNAAGRMGQWLLNWSGRGRQQPQAQGNTNINIFNGAYGGLQPGQQPGPQQPATEAPKTPKVYVPNEKRVGARRIASRAPVMRGEAIAEQQKMMMERMTNSAEPTPAPFAAPGADPNAAAAAAPAAAPNAAAAPAANPNMPAGSP